MLADDTWGDKEALAKLTSKNSKLVVQIGKINEKIAELTKVIVKLAEGKPGSTRTKPGYCWTHGMTKTVGFITPVIVLVKQ